jgi:toxin ParE1/3/4
MKLRFTPRATENIAAIADYIRERNSVASQRVRAAIFASLQDLILFPYIGRLQQTKGVRKFISSTTPSTKLPMKSSFST